MSNCKIMRKKLIRYRTISLTGAAVPPAPAKAPEWHEEECGVPLFSNDGAKVCRSCLNGLTHPENFMLDTPENQSLLAAERARSRQPVVSAQPQT
jgi:hypothetical protein